MPSRHDHTWNKAGAVSILTSATIDVWFIRNFERYERHSSSRL